MKLEDFFGFAQEMSKAIEPMISEIESGGSEKFAEAYRHAALAFKQIAAAELKDKLFIRDFGVSGKQVFYVFFRLLANLTIFLNGTWKIADGSHCRTTETPSCSGLISMTL